MANFEKFLRTRAKSGGNPLVSISKQGLLSFNVACSDKFIKDYNWAELHYDRKERLIGLKLSKDERPDAYKIQRHRNNRNLYMSVSGFLKYFEVMPQKTKAYAVTWDEKDKMLVADLKS